MCARGIRDSRLGIFPRRFGNGDLFVTSVDEDPATSNPALVVRVDPNTGAQTLVAYGELLSGRGAVPLWGIAIEPTGNVLVIGEAAGPGIVRISPATGEQTGIEIGAFPINGIAVVPAPPQHYGLQRLFDPYGAPDVKQFKAGSVIPLKWQYTRDGVVINSSSYQPTVTITGPISCGSVADGIPITVDAAGNSGLQYDATTNTWQYNWKTAKATNGCFNVVVDQPTLRVTRTFPIRVVK